MQNAQIGVIKKKKISSSNRSSSFTSNSILSTPNPHPPPPKNKQTNKQPTDNSFCTFWKFEGLQWVLRMTFLRCKISCQQPKWRQGCCIACFMLLVYLWQVFTHTMFKKQYLEFLCTSNNITDSDPYLSKLFFFVFWGGGGCQSGRTANPYTLVSKKNKNKRSFGGNFLHPSPLYHTIMLIQKSRCSLRLSCRLIVKSDLLPWTGGVHQYRRIFLIDILNWLEMEGEIW